MKILNKQNCEHELGLMLIDNNIECAEMCAGELLDTPMLKAAFEYFSDYRVKRHGNEWAILDTAHDQYIGHVCVRVKDYNRALDLYACLLDNDVELDRMERCMERATYTPKINEESED